MTFKSYCRYTVLCSEPFTVVAEEKRIPSLSGNDPYKNIVKDIITGTQIEKVVTKDLDCAMFAYKVKKNTLVATSGLYCSEDDVTEILANMTEEDIAKYINNIENAKIEQEEARTRAAKERQRKKREEKVKTKKFKSELNRVKKESRFY